MSLVVLLAVMAAWTVAASVVGSRWHGIVPPDLEAVPEEGWWAAIQAFLATQAYYNVRRWRRVIVTGGLVLIVLAWGVYEDEQRDIQREKDRRERAEQIAERDCETRYVSRGEIRSAIEAGVDEIARYAELSPANRQQVVSQVRDRVYNELPPPDC